MKSRDGAVIFAEAQRKPLKQAANRRAILAGRPKHRWTQAPPQPNSLALQDQKKESQ